MNTTKEELNSFMKKYRSDALAVFRKDGKAIAYGWKPSELKKELEKLINQQVLQALEEVKSKAIKFDHHEWAYKAGDKNYTEAATLSAIEQIEEKYR